jgi:hypothetical protein
MKKNFLKMLGIAMLSMNLIETPVQAVDTTIPDTKLISFQGKEFLDQTSAFTGSAVGTAAILYIGYNYLIRQDYLVEKKFPMAFAWYEAMAEKYPGIFDGIYFVQTPKSSMIPDMLAGLAKKCNWTHQENRIYFAKDDLKQIQFIYNKVVDGYPLNKKEAQTLARYEFTLLHQAAYIANQDSKKFVAGLAGILTAAHGTEFVYNKLTGSTSKSINPKDKNVLAGQELLKLEDVVGKKAASGITETLKLLNLPSKIPAVLATGTGAASIAGIVALLRYQEAQADKFVLEHATTETLQAALALYENDDVDTLYQLETKTVDAYIPAASALESAIQSVMQPIEYTALYAAQQFYLLFKQTAVTRWIFDFTQDALHQGPSIRAQNIKDEIARRQA